jgi:hypothetical protein
MIRLRTHKIECDGQDRYEAAGWFHSATCWKCSGEEEYDCDGVACDCLAICARDGCWSTNVNWLVDDALPMAKCQACGNVFELEPWEFLAAHGMRVSMRPCVDHVVARRLPALACAFAPVVVL